MPLTMTRPGMPLVWLRGEIKTPPFLAEARPEAGGLSRRLQRGEVLGMPHSRPMPAVGPRCHDLRVRDARHDWGIIYCVDPDAIVILDVFSKTTRQTPERVIRDCQRRLRLYDALV